MRGKGFNHLPAVIHSLDSSVREVVEKVTVDVAAGADARAPVDTGALAASYTPEMDGDTGTAGSNMEYAPYVEYGTVHSGAQPHLVPAADAVDNNMRQYAKQLGDMIEGAARRG